MIDFSVAIHSYNREEFIVETVESVLNQTLAPQEVIVVDDGSSDNTEAVLEPYSDRIVYKKIANVGCGTSRKVAVEYCQNKWIACNDDDDIWLPTHLESLSNTIESFPKAEYVFSNHTQFGDRAVANYDHFATAPSGWWESVSQCVDMDNILLTEDAFLDFLTFNPSFPSAWAFTKQAYFKAGGIDDKYSRMNSEDSDFTRRILLAAQGACTSQKTVKLRRHGKNMSDNFVANLKGKALILEDIVAKGIVPDRYLSRTVATINQSKIQAFRHLYWQGDHRESVSYAKESNIKLSIKDRLRMMNARFQKT